jgi:CrcB protein
MIQKICLLALAGAVGTLARYGLSGFVHRINGVSFPWGTITVNLTGCLLAGLLWTLFENRWPISGEMRMIVLVGFMGAFTTFSAMILETGELVRSAEWIYALANLTIQNVIGFIALFVGVVIGRMV